MRVAFTIQGAAASKANSRRLVLHRGVPHFIKSAEASGFETLALLQIPVSARVMYAGPVRVTVWMFYPDERRDLDESIVLDVMQTRFTAGGAGKGKVARRGVIVNDRQVREKHIYHAIDAEHPRVEVLVESLGA